MAYQTVLVHLDLDPHCAVRVAWAARLAAPGGLLVGVALSGVSRLLYQGRPEADDDQYLALHLAFLRERANAALASFSQLAAAPGMPACDSRLVDDEAASGLSLQARSADLLVLSHRDASADLSAQVLQHAGRPVLLVPASVAAPARQSGPPRRIMVAWDASREASRALASALPLLRQAERVELVVCEADPGSRIARDVALADPLPWLARHGVRASLRHTPLAAGRLKRDMVGETLLSVAAGTGAEILVMGAYAHSRLRETLLGGVTRTVLAQMGLPVLLEH